MPVPEIPKNLILDCGHCGNRTPHTLEHSYSKRLMFDMADDEPIMEAFEWVSYSCATCGGLNIFGDFFLSQIRQWDAARLHPRSVALSPPSHTVSPGKPVPDSISRIYQEVWPLRHRSPTAFVGQIRRLLEFVCQDQSASGRDLFRQLDDLRQKGLIPGHIDGIADLLRRVGNLGAHATSAEITTWDAELIDDFFRFLIDYIYIAPAKIKRLQERLAMHEA